MTALRLIRDFCGLKLSQRRHISEHFGVTRSDPMETDLDLMKRTIDAVAAGGKQVEFLLLVDDARKRQVSIGF